jgi:hypothetical protein
MPSYLGALYPNYISNKEIFVCPTFRKIAGNELIKLHAFSVRGLVIKVYGLLIGCG